MKLLVYFQDDVKQELVDTSEQLITAQAQRDRNAIKLEQIAQRRGTESDEQDGVEEPGLTVLTGHLNRIAALEKEVKRLKQVAVPSSIRMLCIPGSFAHCSYTMYFSIKAKLCTVPRMLVNCLPFWQYRAAGHCQQNTKFGGCPLNAARCRSCMNIELGIVFAVVFAAYCLTVAGLVGRP